MTFTDHLEIPQGLQFVRIQRSRKITPFIIWLSLFSPRVIYKLNKFPLQKGTVNDYERHPFLVTIEKEKVCRLKSINSERWDLLDLWVELY